MACPVNVDWHRHILFAGKKSPHAGDAGTTLKKLWVLKNKQAI